MTDRELLDLAAKAAGFRITWGEKYIIGDDEVDCTDLPYIVGADREEADSYWNPLEDDGDALRLAVTLGFSIHVLKNRMEPLTEIHWAHGYKEEGHSYDAAKATRRAIVRAAAEIGKAMQ